VPNSIELTTMTDKTNIAMFLATIQSQIEQDRAHLHARRPARRNATRDPDGHARLCEFKFAVAELG
jgi:hypothetical protein